MNRYLALKGKDKFDISKVTVVGSPTITSDGIASGFDTGNYITATTFNPSDKPWTISFNFKPNLLNDMQVLLSQFQNNIKVILTSGNKIILELNAGSWSSDRIIYHTFNETIVSNIDYNIEFGFTGSSYFAKLTNLSTNNSEKVNVESTKILQEPSNNVLNLGGYKSSNASTTILDPFGGSIDLPSFKVTTNGTTFSPTKPVHLLERRKEGFDLSKFTVVGTPTIIEYGVASGFSSSSYFQLKNIGSQLQNATNWSIKFPIIFAEGTTNTRQEIFGGTSSSNPYSLIVRLWQSGYIIVPVNGVTNTGNFSLQSKQTVVANTLYNLEVKVQDNVIYFYINDELQAQHNVTEKVKFDDILRLGNSLTTGSPFLGSIDLTQFSITVDGKEIFTGAKENYYVLRS